MASKTLVIYGEKHPQSCLLVGGFNQKYEFVNGKDYPIYYGK
jgi:hypothetical protein